MKAKKLFKDLVEAAHEIHHTEPPGNPDADFPAQVMCSLAAMMLAQREGGAPPLDCAELIDTICGSISFVLERFTEGNPENLLLIRDAIAALDLLSPSRPGAKEMVSASAA
jgi:hypothetical protein